LVGSVAGLYLGVVASVLHLRRTAADYERRLMFQLPLTLEALILLVESGLGILPALEQLVSSKGNSAKNNPVIRILGLVYRLASNGIPFSRAASMVANSIENRAMRHVLLHLELSRSEGGSIGASLRSLSDHAHNEWKASVETRVKRLENQVIFPVFGCVIGLMVLVSAVPLVSIKDFSDRLDKSADARVVKDKEFQPRN
jgi:Flp pilus assembly protein TadB